MKLRNYYEIEDSPLAGTVIEPIYAFIAVKYPHRKTKDLYVPPFSGGEKNITSPWKCCQKDCKSSIFYGGLDDFVKHLELHAGRLLNKKKRRVKAVEKFEAVK